MPKLSKLLRLLGHRTYRHGLWQGVGAAIEHRAFIRSFPFNALLDVGANKGQFSLAARAERPHARIIAFEPLEGPSDLYERLFAGDRSVRLIRAALGSCDGEAVINISRREDSSSLLPIGRLQREVFPGTEAIATQTVPVRRLSELVDGTGLESPALLKIDVQGFELEVLKGAEDLLPKIDGIYVELSFLPLYDGQPLANEIVDWLGQRGFVFAGVYHIAHDAAGRAVQADIYFRREQATSSNP